MSLFRRCSECRRDLNIDKYFHFHFSTCNDCAHRDPYRSISQHPYGIVEPFVGESPRFIERPLSTNYYVPSYHTPTYQLTEPGYAYDYYTPQWSSPRIEHFPSHPQRFTQSRPQEYYYNYPEHISTRQHSEPPISRQIDRYDRNGPLRGTNRPADYWSSEDQCKRYFENKRNGNDENNNQPVSQYVSPRETKGLSDYQPTLRRPRVLILFYSTYGHIFHMAKSMAEGVREAGSDVVIKRVPETLSRQILEKMHAVDAQKAFDHIEVAKPNELSEYDCILFGAPTRFGGMPGQMATFLDATGGLWSQGSLVGKLGGVFTSSASQHGGNESTILSFVTYLFHQGMVIAGLPPSYQGQMGIDELNGGSPYGATTIAGGKGERLPSKKELDGAKFQGKHTAQISSRLIR
eukprot:NODE_2179_length_1662_cov_53.671215_g1865_i0.p1 GENE.NODE_2179_length_1662_cov_53.671215_g1865_i0~~NODE_2179_length_1662_cov_53.671215_g1865_i0.p1  ORF type:complete len:405 (-),score=83.12 NODE_2179_length_1662_cov_53.671215_g1865_i0:387-1601(-)